MNAARHPATLILTAVASIAGTVACLGYYGYLHFARPEDALRLDQFTWLKTVPGQDYRARLSPADPMAQCIDGVLVLFDSTQKGLSGVLVDDRQRVVRCTSGQ